jgi:hypothetical protein
VCFDVVLQPWQESHCAAVIFGGAPMRAVTDITTDFWTQMPLGLYLAPLLKPLAIILLSVFILRSAWRLITSGNTGSFGAVVWRGIVPTAVLAAILFAPASFLPGLIEITTGAVKAAMSTLEVVTTDASVPSEPSAPASPAEVVAPEVTAP